VPSINWYSFIQNTSDGNSLLIDQEKKFYAPIHTPYFPQGKLPWQRDLK